MSSPSPDLTSPTPVPQRQRSWARLRRELLFISWGAMEISLITPLAMSAFLWLNQWSPASFALGLLLLLLVPFYLVRLLAWLRFSLVEQQQILWALGLVVVLFIIRTLNYQPAGLFDFRWVGQFFSSLLETNSNNWQRDLSLFLVLALTWWRGLALVSRTIDALLLGIRFRRGLLYAAPLAALLAFFRLPWSILPFLLAYAVLGLTAMVLTRIEQAERDQHGILAALDGRWLSAVIGGGLALALLAGGTAVTAAGRLGEIFAGFFDPLWQAMRWAGASLGFTVAYILSPLMWPLERGLQGILSFVNRLIAALFTEVENRPDPGDFQGAPNEYLLELLTRQAESGGLVVNWRLVLLLTLLLIVVAGMLLLAVYYRRNRAGAASGRFATLVQTISSRVRPPQRGPRAPGERAFRRWQQEAAQDILRLYAQMLTLAEEWGYGRDPAETPYEYLTTLQQVWPDYPRETADITAAYIKVRYGELPESAAEFAQLQQAWKRLKGAEIKPRKQLSPEQN